MKPNLKDVKLPKTWGQIKGGEFTVVCHEWKHKPTIEVSEVSRIKNTWKRKWLRECPAPLHDLIKEMNTDLGHRLSLRSRARKGR